MPTRTPHFGWFLLVAVLTGLWVCGSAPAAPVYSSGSATITHDAGGGGDPAPVVTTVSSLPSSETLQYAENTLSKTVGSDTSTSTGAGGIWQITLPNVCGLAFPGKTGVSQNDTAGLFSDAATLTVNFTGVWDIDAGGFGPTLYAGAVFSVTGSVGDGGGWVKMLVTASFTSAAHGSLRSAILTPFYYNDTPGAFSVKIKDFEICDPTSLDPGDTLTISGNIEFFARSGTGASSWINVPDGDRGYAPEPAVLALLVVGGGVMILLRRRRP